MNLYATKAARRRQRRLALYRLRSDSMDMQAATKPCTAGFSGHGLPPARNCRMLVRLAVKRAPRHSRISGWRIIGVTLSERSAEGRADYGCPCARCDHRHAVGGVEISQSRVLV